MHRSTVLALIAAWIIGIATALVWPGLTTERMMLASDRPQTDLALLHDYAVQGWTVQHAVADRYYVLERPRFRLP